MEEQITIHFISPTKNAQSPLKLFITQFLGSAACSNRIKKPMALAMTHLGTFRRDDGHSGAADVSSAHAANVKFEITHFGWYCCSLKGCRIEWWP